jgi:uncharacterized protein YxeA
MSIIAILLVIIIAVVVFALTYFNNKRVNEKMDDFLNFVKDNLEKQIKSEKEEK